MNSEGMPQMPRPSQYDSLNGHKSPVSPSDRQKLVMSTEESFDRPTIEPEAPQHYPRNGSDDSHLNRLTPNGRPQIPSYSEKPRHPRDERKLSSSTATKRTAGPYTANPPIDFDGLSWPSKLPPWYLIFLC